MLFRSDEAKREDLVKVTIGDDPEKFFQIGSQLPQQERERGADRVP